MSQDRIHIRMKPNTRAKSARIIDGDGELGGGHVLQRQRDDRGQQDAEHGHARAQRPHRQRAAHDAGCEAARRRTDFERLRGDRTQCELGEQIAAGRHDDAGKADAQQRLSE